MIDNETLRKRLAPKLQKLNLSAVEEDQLIREMNYLSNVIIDGYIATKALNKPNYDDSKTDQSQ